MRISDFKRLGVDYRTLPISRLRAIDIQSVEEEQEIASILAERMKGTLPVDKVNIDDIKARLDRDVQKRVLTKEKELEYQKEVDARLAEVNARLGVKEEVKEVKKFCEFCDAVGPISHKKECTRPKQVA